MFIALVLYLPFIGNITSNVIGKSGDVYQYIWYLWWAKYAVTNLGGQLFSTTRIIFWPIGVNMAYQPSSPIDGLLSIPLQLVSIGFAYNVLFFLGFAVSGLCAFIFIEYITKNQLASFVGGAIFDFSALHTGHITGMDFFFVGWMALFLYFFMRNLLEGDTKIWPMAAGATLVLIVFMDEPEECLMALLAAMLIIVFYALQKSKRAFVFNKRFAISLLLMFVTASVLGSWGIIPIAQALFSNGGLSVVMQQNTISNNIGWSANILSFFVPNYLFYLGSFSFNTNILQAGLIDRICYIGYTALFLMAVHLRKSWRKSAMWFAMLLIFILLSLGPYITIGNTVTGIPGPYLLLKSVPILNVIREPDRFNFMSSLFIGLIAALGTADILAKMRSKNLDNRYVYGFLSIVIILYILESFGLPFVGQMPTSSTYIPQAISSLGSLNGNYSFLVLPASPIPNYIYDGLAEYYISAMDKPLVGGFVARETPLDSLTLFSMPLITEATYLATYDNASYYNGPYTSPINENYTLQSLKTLSDYKTAFIILEDGAYTQQAFGTVYYLLNRTFGSPIYADRNITIFSTQKALSTNLYRQFISYYEPEYWGQLAYDIDGVNTTWWTPANKYGVIVTYAPAAGNQTQVNGTYLNATMNFEAFAEEPQELSIQYYPAVPDAPHLNYTIEVGTQPKLYSVKMRLIKGQQGNVIGFFDGYIQTKNESNIVAIDNITFEEN
jgi:hypothetical protein